MISETLRIALAATAPNRSHDSWIAGSCVFAELIDRVPNDVDIHHVTMEALIKSVGDDTNAMLAANFSLISRQVEDREWEAVFMHSSGRLTLKWVLEPQRPNVILNDPILGARASYADVTSRKAEMAREDDQEKHTDDLLAVLNKSASVATELDRTRLALTLFDLETVRKPNSNVLPESLEVKLFEIMVRGLTGIDNIAAELVSENLTILRREKETIGDISVLIRIYAKLLFRDEGYAVEEQFMQGLSEAGMLPLAEQVIYLFFLGAIRSRGGWKQCGWPQHENALVWSAFGVHPPVVRGTGDYVS